MGKSSACVGRLPEGVRVALAAAAAELTILFESDRRLASALLAARRT